LFRSGISPGSEACGEAVQVATQAGSENPLAFRRGAAAGNNSENKTVTNAHFAEEGLPDRVAGCARHPRLNKSRTVDRSTIFIIAIPISNFGNLCLSLHFEGLRYEEPTLQATHSLAILRRLIPKSGTGQWPARTGSEERRLIEGETLWLVRKLVTA
jgi:hypothetical protein